MKRIIGGGLIGLSIIFFVYAAFQMVRIGPIQSFGLSMFLAGMVVNGVILLVAYMFTVERWF